MSRPDICVIVSDTQKEIYFTVTQKYTISRSANVTDFRIESGRQVTDHHSANNERFVFSGIVTTQAALGDTEGLSPSVVKRKLDALILTGEKFKFISDSDLAFNEVEDCALISYDISRDETMADAIEVSVEIRQLQFVDSVDKVVATTASVEMRDRVAEKNSNGNAGTEQVELSAEEQLKISNAAQRDVVQVIRRNADGTIN